MKKQTFKQTLIVIFIIVILPCFSFCQSEIVGKWEGLFMNDFKTMVEINPDEHGILSGYIKMFSGENMIQNDPITKIALTENQVTFFIAAKETNFKGEINNKYTRLSGIFLFPDKSEHSIELGKKAIETESKEALINAFNNPESIKFSNKELITDLEFLVDNLKKYHPRLYAFTPENEFNKLVDSAKQNFKPDLNVVEFFTLIAPVTEKVKCSHTGIQLPNEIQNERIESGNYLPLKLIFTGNKAYCVESLEHKPKIIPGDEILSINDVSVDLIKKKLYTFFPSEGNNTTTKDFYLKNSFNIYFNLIDNSATFKVEYKSKHRIQNELLKAFSYAELGKTKDSGNESPLFVTLDNNSSTCYLTVNSFQFQDINEYIQKLNDIFLPIDENNIQHLVLDLRGNSGGHPIFAAQLFSYLTQKEFTWFKRNVEIKEFEPLYNKMEPNSLNFDGELYVLTDGGCLSTTGHLLSQIKYNTNAIFVGEEPGSSGLCNDFSIQVTLPNTGIEVNIPRTTFETAINDSDRMIPFTVDYCVSFSIEDYLKGVDSYIKCVNNLVFKSEI